MASPHTVLGVSRNATANEVKRAYREMAKQTHPDLNDGDDLRFKAVTSAYESIVSGGTEQAWRGCSNAGTSRCSMRNGCGSMWEGPQGERFVWNDSMLPELFSALLAETGDARLQALYTQYVESVLTRKQMLLSIHTYATREQFRTALKALAQRHHEEGGEQRVMSYA